MTPHESELRRQFAALRWLADLDRRGVGLCQPNEKRAAEREADARLLEQRAAEARRPPCSQSTS